MAFVCTSDLSNRAACAPVTLPSTAPAQVRVAVTMAYRGNDDDDSVEYSDDGEYGGVVGGVVGDRRRGVVADRSAAFATEQYATDEYVTQEYAADEYATEEYATDEYAAGQQYGLEATAVASYSGGGERRRPASYGGGDGSTVYSASDHGGAYHGANAGYGASGGYDASGGYGASVGGRGPVASVRGSMRGGDSVSVVSSARVQYMSTDVVMAEASQLGRSGPRARHVPDAGTCALVWAAVGAHVAANAAKHKVRSPRAVPPSAHTLAGRRCLCASLA